MVEVVAEEHVGWGGLFGGGFEGGMGINEGHGGEPAAIGDAEEAGASIVVFDVFHEPVDGVVGVGGLVNGTGFGFVAERAGHDELAFGLVASADVLEDEEVAFAGEVFLAGFEEGFGAGVAVGGALDEEGEFFGGGGGGAVEFGVEFYAVAHGDHVIGFGVRGLGGEGAEWKKEDEPVDSHFRFSFRILCIRAKHGRGLSESGPKLAFPICVRAPSAAVYSSRFTARCGSI